MPRRPERSGKRELTDYECQPHQISPYAWYYHALGKKLHIVVDTEKLKNERKSGPYELVLSIPRILNAEKRRAKKP